MTLAKRYDIIMGARLASTTVTGEETIGGTVGAGIRFDSNLRVVLGANLSHHNWAFDGDDSIPGVFLNITGLYGMAGSPADYVE